MSDETKENDDAVKEPHAKFRENMIEMKESGQERDTSGEPDINESTCDPEVIRQINMIIERLKEEIQAEKKQSAEYLDKYKRGMADFDNFRKRTAREKSEYFDGGARGVLEAILPCMDDLERALSANADKDDTFYKGIELIHKRLRMALTDAGASEIHALGETFNPALHNAVEHVSDAGYGENVVVAEHRKGYMFKDKVLRPSMVKVAN
ncbi:MAG: nucleotide exchange factor GrpE [Clostridiales bacterium]|nr:nucleotide exchange factor GrpE [Clostridiales bacterium]